MATSDERELFCPRCRYNLRGLSERRCPECGLTFPPEQWESGLLRDSVRTWLDRCDPWQPHQVLLRSLYEMVRGAFMPWRLFTKLDLDGPLVSAILMLIFGTFWLYALTSLLMGAAVCLYAGASPAAALKSAALYWSPRLLVLMTVNAVTLLGIALLGPVPLGRSVRDTQLTTRKCFRVAAYWVPSVGLYVFIPLALLLAVPQLILAPPGVWPVLATLPGLAAMICVTHVGHCVKARVPVSWTQAVISAVCGVVCLCVWFANMQWLAAWLLPDEFGPALWACS